MDINRLTLSVSIEGGHRVVLRVERYRFPSPGRPEWIDHLVVPASGSLDTLDPLEVLERAIKLLQGQGDYLR